MSTDVAPRPLLTRRDLADLLRVSTRTVDRLRKRGLIEPVQLVPGGRVVFRREDVVRLIAHEPSDPRPAREDELSWH